MFRKDQYQLLDFGDGRKLERFGPYILDRPCAAAEGMQKRKEKAWKKANGFYTGKNPGEGNWKSNGAIPLSWNISHGRLSFELKLTDFGHVGVFPEHAVNWEWLAQQIKAGERPVRVLNLFAYTGGVTLSAAAAGAEIVHVDAAQNVVLWARRNTEASDLSDAPIRWITEDAQKFVEREIKRGNKYHGLVLDPPTYGHGPKGEIWKIDKDLPELLKQCVELIDDDFRFVLLSCHSTKYRPDDLVETLCSSLPSIEPGEVEAGGLAIPDAEGRHLLSGVAARWVKR